MTHNRRLPLCFLGYIHPLDEFRFPTGKKVPCSGPGGKEEPRETMAQEGTGTPRAAPPTCLVRGDVDHSGTAGLGAQVGHTVDSLNPEGVVHVGQQVGHQQAGLCQACLLRDEAGSTPTSLTVAQGPGAAPAHCVVGDVTAAAWVQGRGPLQGHRCSIHTGDQVDWC